MNEKRVRKLNDREMRSGPVVYWMSRDQRAHDNWALFHAKNRAVELQQPLAVVFCLVLEFLGATRRHYAFMFKGLEETRKNLFEKNIPFFLLRGEPGEVLPEFLEKIGAGVLVTDFDPLRIKEKWKEDVSAKIEILFEEVDAHNIVPVWIASQKQEFAARTLRPKIHKLLSEFLDDYPPFRKQNRELKEKPDELDFTKLLDSLPLDDSVGEVDWIRPGPKAARKTLKKFISAKLADYDSRRNDPLADATSNLSPYLHFGQISAQRVALEIDGSDSSEESKEAFLEELIVRRELADNFCFYNRNYDSVKGFPDWARKTLKEHAGDKREYRYSYRQFEQGETHDPLWNAAQKEMVIRGKMPGYLRMYWAKKILEWTSTPREALKIAIKLNDRYELDGRDPNGYAGAAWSIGGIHDRPWPERKIFGKIRFMSYNGCRRKFDVDTYIAQSE